MGEKICFLSDFSLPPEEMLRSGKEVSLPKQNLLRKCPALTGQTGIKSYIHLILNQIAIPLRGIPVYKFSQETCKK
jgi:hypothetical protein